MTERESQRPIDPWKDIEEFLSGLTAAGVHLTWPNLEPISLDQAGSHVKPVLQISQTLFSTKVPPEDVIKEWFGREPHMEYRLEDANGKEVEFPIRVVIERKYQFE